MFNSLDFLLQNLGYITRFHTSLEIAELRGKHLNSLEGETSTTKVGQYKLRQCKLKIYVFIIYNFNFVIFNLIYN